MKFTVDKTDLTGRFSLGIYRLTSLNSNFRLSSIILGQWLNCFLYKVGRAMVLAKEKLCLQIMIELVSFSLPLKEEISRKKKTIIAL